MPSLSERLQSNGATSGFTPVVAPTPTTPQVVTTATIRNQHTVSPYMRCPMPTIWGSSPDAIKQWELGGRAPQQRSYTPQ